MVGRMMSVVVGLIGFALVARGEPVVRVGFDGGKEAGVILGRGELVDSIIGGGGKALWCEGVDTAVRVEAGPKMAEGFAVGLWVCPLEMRAGGVMGGGSGKGAWGLEVTKGNALRFTIGGATVAETPADRIGAGQWYHVVVSGERGGKCAMYANGEIGAAGTAAVEDSAGPMWVGRTSEKGPGFVGLVDDVRAYGGAMPAAEVAAWTDEGLPWIRPKAAAHEGFRGKFALAEHDVVALVGGEDLYAAQTAGYLETLLTLKAGGTRVSFRNMAWEGDTAFEQWRILNFGTWARQFERVGASVIVVQFGKVESLRGAEGLKDFSAAYEKLLEEFSKRTARIVVVSPTPFEDAGPLLPPAKGRNEVLMDYAAAAKGLAEKRGLLYVDLFAALGGHGRAASAEAASGAMTRDGMHLTPRGQWAIAREMARQLGVKAGEAVTEDDEPRFVLSGVEELRQAVVAKNQWWLRAWRPPNWAFLNGDRITQPSSRDDKDARVRWLPAEWQRYPVMVDREEAKIARMAKGLKE